MKVVTKTALAMSSEATFWTPASGHKFKLKGGILASSVTGNVTFKDGTAGTTILVVPMVATIPVVVNLPDYLPSSAIDKVLTVTGPAASTISGSVWGLEEFPG